MSTSRKRLSFKIRRFKSFLEDFYYVNHFLLIIEALKHMHAKEIMHRDIKLENILFKKAK
jgi:serine/threonine protein kinase